MSASRSYNIDFITLDGNLYIIKNTFNFFFIGDQINRRGAITGGYYDLRYSRLEAMKSIQLCRKKLESISHEAKKIKKELQDIDQQINQVLGEIQKKESDKTSIKDGYEQATQRIKTLQKDVQTYKEIIHQKVFIIIFKKNEIFSIRNKLKCY